MKLTKKQIVVGIALTTSLALSACGGSSGDSGAGSTGIITSGDFTFPAEDASGNGIEMPEGDAPEFSARRTLSKGTGSPIEFGDPVVLQYDMYSWSTGELIESTDTLDEPLTIRAGVTNGVPEYLTKSLLGRQVGDTMQVVFERGMEDLPDYLDNTDAYVLFVSVL